MSVRSATLQKKFVPLLSHPTCAREVSFPSAVRALRFPIRINLKHNSSDLAPIRMLGVGIEEAQISNLMLFIIAGENRIGRCAIGNGRVGGRN